MPLIAIIIGIAVLLAILYAVAFIVVGIGLIIFIIPIYILFTLYVVLEFISTNIFIVLDELFYPGFNVSPAVAWAFWGLVIGAAIQGYREMNTYGRKEKGVLIILAPVVLLAILKLISPLGSAEVHSLNDPVADQRPAPSPPPAQNNDHSDTSSGATSLSLGNSLSGQIEPGSDVDYFKVQVSKSGVLTVYTTGTLDTRGILQNSSGATLVKNFDDGSGKNFKIAWSVDAGTYYVKVESYRSHTGSYTIHASFRDLHYESVRAKAEQGDATAQNSLGVIYDRGKGVAQDYAEAAKWYRKAAEQGNDWGQYNLGFMYARGEGVAQDYAEAAKWYRKAAEQGNASAQNNLGVMYVRGEGVAQDYAEAAKWYRKAAEQRNASAQNNLGRRYERGEGVPQDYVTAYMWYVLAEAGGKKESFRKDISTKMTSAQIGEAKRRAREWKPVEK